MSLDVYLMQEVTRKCECCDREGTFQEEVFESNITHNLSKMANLAGIYDALWNPIENQMTLAEDIIEPLTEGLKKLKDKPEFYKELNPENGWGNYELFIKFIEEYLNACIKYPKAIIGVSI